MTDMNTVLKDQKKLSRKTLWATLDEEFRDFSMMSVSSFPPDEFDEKEAAAYRE